MSPVGPVNPDVVRALVRQALEENLGIRPASRAPLASTRFPQAAHASLTLIAEGPECSEDIDFPNRKPCLIEPHRPCYNSGYCRKLGH